MRIVQTHQFKKDIKRQQKRGKNLQAIKDVSVRGRFFCGWWLHDGVHSMMRRSRATADQSSRALSALRIPAKALIASMGTRRDGAAWMIREKSPGVKMLISESGTLTFRNCLAAVGRPGFIGAATAFVTTRGHSWLHLLTALPCLCPPLPGGDLGQTFPRIPEPRISRMNTNHFPSECIGPATPFVTTRAMGGSTFCPPRTASALHLRPEVISD